MSDGNTYSIIFKFDHFFSMSKNNTESWNIKYIIFYLKSYYKKLHRTHFSDNSKKYFLKNWKEENQYLLCDYLNNPYIYFIKSSR